MANGNNDEGAADKLWTAMVNAGAGVVVVLVALIVLAIMTSYLVSAVTSDDAKLAIATTALGVISAVIAAFFGVKSATDSRKDTQEQAKEQIDKVVQETREAGDKRVSEAQDASEKLIAAALAADPNDQQMKEALVTK